jgi:hypothetical protein
MLQVSFLPDHMQQLQPSSRATGANAKGNEMKSLIAAAAVLAALAAPALAGDCPNQLKMVEDMLSTATLDDAAKTKIQEHINQAKAEHEAGKHAESLVTLKDASQLAGM